MFAYVAKRLIMAMAVVYVVLSLSFFMIRLMPGSPVSALEGQLRLEGVVNPVAIQARVNEIYALQPKGPIWKQYLVYIWHALHGNLGRSVSNPGVTVAHVIAGALPWTIFVVAVALIISFLIGIGIGAAMAAFADSWFAKVMTFVSSVLSAIPSYLIAIILLYFLTDVYRLFPIGGAYGVDVQVGLNGRFIASIFYHAMLPIAAYVIISFGGWALGMKGTAVSVLGAEYVRAAESRGLTRRRVAQSYIGRNAMLPQVTSLALSIGFMFGGSVFIETFFLYPGLGYYLIHSVDARDYSVMMGCFLVITIAVVLANLAVDLLYPLVDPRIAMPGGSRGSREHEPMGGAAAVAGGAVA